MSPLSVIVIALLWGPESLPAQPGPTGAVVRSLGQADTITFRLTQGVVEAINLYVHGAEYTVPLACAGGLLHVHFETAELGGQESDAAATPGTFAVFFDKGSEADRRFGKLPRVQLSFYRHRLIEMLVTTATGKQSAFSAKLCATVPVGPITCKDTRDLQGLPPEVLVEQLKDIRPRMPAGGPPTEPEVRRRRIYEELLDWGTVSVPALVAALQDADVRLRQHAALAFGILGGGWYRFECGPARVDIEQALPDLVGALDDPDALVRAWSTQAIGGLGPKAAAAVPRLAQLLDSDDTSTNYSAIMALGFIGPSASAALPTLRRGLSDPDAGIRRATARAIERIQQP